jgi:Capsule assembly protein Wzi/PAP2 superfamily
MIRKSRIWLSVSVLVLGVTVKVTRIAHAQELESPEKKVEMNTEQQASSPQPVGVKEIHVPMKKHNWLLERAEDFGGDQKELWTSPRDLRFSDTAWLVPISGFAAGLFVTDADVNRHMSHDPQTISHYQSISNAGLAGLVGGAGALWALSYKNHDSHWRETGFLAGEAALNSLVVSEAAKYSFGRQRPYQGTGAGDFFQGGTSFPSEHAAAAWSIAAIIAHEYPGPLTKILAYGLAGLVSYSRVRAQQHFSSDVLVGSLIGELSAYVVYKRHHDPELGGDEWESWSAKARRMFADPSPGYRGSPYVPLDSWIYPALDRLAGMRLIDSAFAGMRPWTRRECARLVSEASDRVDDHSIAGEIYRKLEEEFKSELDPSPAKPQVVLDSIYARATGLSGPPLTDGYTFGQTIINDYGRPYEEGTNFVSGLSFWSSAGPWVGYVRGEYQYAPSAPALPLSAREVIAASGGLPSVPPGTPIPAVNRFELLDAYAGLTLSNWEFSFGRQSLSWGPGDGGSLMFSNNAAPIDMFRVNRVTPLSIPLVSRILGPMRLEFFFGQLTGHYFVGGPNGVEGSFSDSLSPQPYIHGQRFSFKPTRNFEFGFSRTTIMGGPGVPLTFGTFGHSLFGSRNGPPGTPQDPGDRRSGMDWSYRLPKLRRWVTFYGDAFADDQFSPIAYWDRSAIRGGMYFSHLPYLPRLDLRVEGVYTDVPAGGAIGGGFFYSNTRFLNGYTNDGNLIGSWIGRDGQGAQAWANYWFTSKNRLQISYRHQKVSQDPRFVPGGGTITDVGVRGDVWKNRQWGLSANAQYEVWTFPVIQTGQQTNFSTAVQVTFRPAEKTKHSTDD